VTININTRQLEAFITLAETGSFTLAAKRLHITQPSLSNQIKLLENILGISLFNRNTRNISLTEAGRTFQRFAHSLLNQLTKTEQELKLLAAGAGGKVHFSALLTVCASLVPESIKRHNELFPEVRVNFREAISSEVAEQVSLGDVHFGICTKPENLEGFSFRPLYQDNILLAVSKNRPIADKEFVFWEELLDLPFIALNSATSVRELSEKAFSAHGRQLKPVYEANSQSTILGMVASDLGVSALPASVAMMLKYPNVRLIPLHHPDLYRQIGILTLKGQKLTPNTNTFLKTIFTVLKEQDDNITLYQQ